MYTKVISKLFYIYLLHHSDPLSVCLLNFFGSEYFVRFKYFNKIKKFWGQNGEKFRDKENINKNIKYNIP